ncbi:phosphatidylserine decarboxylase-domain-containing protein [Limtongia smithiae]|uniref:phosphatidylserine decarboxylase-domain-containing protein n=1 Tax=Limtongia smithiae TaxID=1125753 RepID=UPI0034CDF3FA
MPPPPYLQPPSPSTLRYMRRRPHGVAGGAAVLRFPARAASGFLRYPLAKVSRRQMWSYPGFVGKRAFFSRGAVQQQSTNSATGQQQQQQQQGGRRRFRFRWWHVPVAGGLTAVAVRYGSRYRRRYQEIDDSSSTSSDEEAPVRRYRPVGPWQIFVYSSLPLKTLSRLWGKFNAIELPLWMREPGYKIYAYVFGVNLDEVAEDDLRIYRNLGEFFFRELKPGARPIDKSLLVSPADGKVLHLGVVYGRQVEQVKGMTYSLDALLGEQHPDNASTDSLPIDFSSEHKNPDMRVESDREFAVMNGIKYSLDDLLGEKEKTETVKEGEKATAPLSASQQARVRSEIVQPTLPDHEMFFCVIYLAPGDYHRFHSPTSWVAEMRRHIAGELYSVAPYFQHRLSGLFVLNERVAMLGRWRHGFFSMTPVGATNVGSIKIHFDKDLKTNDPSIKHRNLDKPICYEATYANASKVLGGYPLEKGQQMGGFELGSTVVLVFEAPKQFEFSVKAGETVKVGQALGDIMQE